MKKLSTFNFLASRRSGQLSTSDGFTLIELVIVIGIIGILTAAIIFLLNPVLQLQKARDGTRKADLRQIQSALEIYRSDQGNYPNTLPSCGSALTGGSPTITYMQKIPCDPKNTGQYIYRYTSSGITYSLFACLENVNDPQKDSSNNASYCTGGTTNWSFTVINP